MYGSENKYNQFNWFGYLNVLPHFYHISGLSPDLNTSLMYLIVLTYLNIFDRI